MLHLRAPLEICGSVKVVVYEPSYNEKHRTILRAFAEGVPGAIVRDVEQYEPCDVAIIFGGVKKSFEPTWSKQKILDRHQGRSLIMIESAFVKRGEYWQVGFGGCAGNADFRSEDMPMDRWHSFGMKGRPWQDRKDAPVVICGQLIRDTQVQDVDHPKWCRETVAFFHKLGVPLLFRPHPKAATKTEYGVDPCHIDTHPLGAVLKRARCFVTWNSTSAVDAVINGVPVMVCDKSSISWPMGIHEIAHPDNLIFPKREPWLAGLGYSQWSLADMKAGLPWKHLTRP